MDTGRRPMEQERDLAALVAIFRSLDEGHRAQLRRVSEDVLRLPEKEKAQYIDKVIKKVKGERASCECC